MASSENDVRSAGQPPRRVALVGNPNVGKSVLFGVLTGRYVTVSNYPGTTVEVARGGAILEGLRGTEIIDTPGTNNLVPMSEDEAVTRDILLSGEVDAVLQVTDAKNLRRGLLLAFQLAELGLPQALVLNMMDEARARHMAPDAALLSGALGIPVVETVAIERSGVVALAASVRGACPARAGLVQYAAPVEEAVRAALEQLPTGMARTRATALMLLAHDLPLGPRGALTRGLSAAVTKRLAELRAGLPRGEKPEPLFSVLSRARLEAADALVARALGSPTARPARASVPFADPAGHGASALLSGEAVPRPAPLAPATVTSTSRVGPLLAMTAGAGVGAALVLDSALAMIRQAVVEKKTGDVLDELGVGTVLSRVLSTDIISGWHPVSLLLMAVVAALGYLTLRRVDRPARAGMKVMASAAGAYLLFALVWPFAWRLQAAPRWPLLLTAAAFPALLALLSRLDADGEQRLIKRFGRLSMHRFYGLPVLVAVLFLVYKLVGEFGAKTAVDFLETKVFGKLKSEQTLVLSAEAIGRAEVARAQNGALLEYQTRSELVSWLPAEGKARLRVSVEKRASKGGTYEVDGELLPVLTPRGATASAARTISPGIYMVDLTAVSRDGRTAPAVEVRVWTGYLNRWLAGVVQRVPVPLIRDLISGPYGVVTMALTYGIAIVLPIVFMFFLVFSAMEDSGYLPRLAVMVNSTFRLIGLNGKAVLPMILGLGCDTMATLTARIMESRKERILVTLLLALGVPCSAQLGVVLGMLAGVGFGAGLWWAMTVAITMVVVGFIASRVLPGESSDFVLEMPPLRRPQMGNIVTKTTARIEWYLKEALPLFVLGTLILFTLDRLDLLQTIIRGFRPLVVGMLGLPEAAAEAFLIGFLRRDFGATKLFDMAQTGQLTTLQVVVSMVVITLFIPCIANVFMIIKERGALVAVGMVAFIFPFAFGVGGLLNALLRRLPDPHSATTALIGTTVAMTVVSLMLYLARLHDRRKSRRELAALEGGPLGGPEAGKMAA